MKNASQELLINIRKFQKIKSSSQSVESTGKRKSVITKLRLAIPDYNMAGKKDYATDRFREHVDRFEFIADMIGKMVT